MPTFPDVVLRGPRVVLRPVVEADVPDVAASGADDEVQRWIPLPWPYTEADAAGFCSDVALGRRASGQGLVLAIESAGRFCGSVDAKRTDWRARTTELGYWSAPWSRGRGLVSESVRVMSRWLLADQGFSRVELRIAPENLASRRVALAAGFTEEGVLRNAGWTRSGRVDLVAYSLIDTDVEAGKARSSDVGAAEVTETRQCAE